MKPENEEQLQRSFVKLARRICAAFENPENWPLRDDERVVLLRELYWQARNIEQSEPFAKLQVTMALNRSLSPKRAGKTNFRSEFNKL